MCIGTAGGLSHRSSPISHNPSARPHCRHIYLPLTWPPCCWWNKSSLLRAEAGGLLWTATAGPEREPTGSRETEAEGHSGRWCVEGPVQVAAGGRLTGSPGREPLCSTPSVLNQCLCLDEEPVKCYLAWTCQIWDVCAFNKHFNVFVLLPPSYVFCVLFLPQDSLLFEWKKVYLPLQWDYL